MYGCPRHLRRMPEIPWAGSLLDCEVRGKWSPEVEMRIPNGERHVYNSSSVFFTSKNIMSRVVQNFVHL